MKKTITLGVVIIGSIIIKAQRPQIAINDRLLVQLQKNQTARVQSEKSFFRSYEKQKELYDKAVKKVAQVVVIQEYIYNHLYNVNSVFYQSKKLKYIYKDITTIINDVQKIIQLSAKYPQYQVFFTKRYEQIIARALEIREFIQNKILKVDRSVLMDGYERDELISEASMKVRSLRVITYYTRSLLERVKNKPYLMHIPKFASYVDLDKMIISDIIRSYKRL